MLPDRRTFLKTGLAGALAAPGALAPSIPPLGEDPIRTPEGAREGAGESARALRVLILGGTSFLGPHQVHTALGHGHSVSIFTRGRTQPRLHVEDFERVEHLIGDRSNDLSALEGRTWDVVIDNSSRSAAWTRASADLLADSVERYVFTSSTGVYYPYLSTGIDETTPVLMTDERGGEDGSMAYGVAKANSEEIVRERFGERALLMRPGHIVGPGDTQPNRFVYWTERMERGGEVAVPGLRTDPVQWVDVRDLVEFTFRLVESGRGGTFNVTGPANPFTMEEFVYGMRACTGQPVTWVWLDDHEWLAAQGARALIPWILPVGDELGHMSVRNDRALAAGLALRPLARTVFDVMDWWHSDAVPEDVRSGVRFPVDPETEVEWIARWRRR